MTWPTILTAGFRVFFLGAAVFAVAAMVVWLGLQTDIGMAAGEPFSMGARHWHAHEMIWGFASAAVAGFFLTAVPTWTGAPPAGPLAIIALAALWSAGRLAMFFSGSSPGAAVATIDLVFLPLLAAVTLGQLARDPKPRNLMLVGLIALLWTADLVVHLDWMGHGAGDAERGLRAGLLTLAALIAIIGGRVTPAFTRNAGVAGPPPRSRAAVEIVVVAAAIALPALTLVQAPTALIGVVALVAGAGQAVRLAGWRGMQTRHEPMLWSLHLAGLMLAIGYLSLGFAALRPGGEIAALHLIGIGAVGGMTLAMMSRATLGHTGRPLHAGPALTIAFGLIATAALLRVLGWATGPAVSHVAVFGSGLAWCAAFTLFVARMWRPLTTPRAG